MDNTEHALRRAILEQPFDDAPRLIYADWCEENGHELAARFIRWQILRFDAADQPWELEHPDHEVYALGYQTLFAGLQHSHITLPFASWKKLTPLKNSWTAYCPLRSQLVRRGFVDVFMNVYRHNFQRRHFAPLLVQPVTKIHLTGVDPGYITTPDYLRPHTLREQPVQLNCAQPQSHGGIARWLFDLLGHNGIPCLRDGAILNPDYRCYAYRALALEDASRSVVNAWRQLVGLPTIMNWPEPPAP